MDFIYSLNVTRSLRMVYSIKPLYKWQHLHQTVLLCVFPPFNTIKNQTKHSLNLSATALLHQEVKINASDHPIKFQSSLFYPNNSYA